MAPCKTGRVAHLVRRADAGEVQAINRGRLVDDDRDDRRAGGGLAKVLVEQQPRIRALGLGRGGAAGPGETAALNEALLHAEDARLRGLIEIQATSVVAWLDAESEELRRAQLGERQFRATGLGVEIGIDRLIALGQQGEAAGAARALGKFLGGIQAEGAEGDDQEGGRGDEADRGDAAARSPGGVAPGEATERKPRYVAGRFAPQLSPGRGQQRHEDERAAAKEGAGLRFAAETPGGGDDCHSGNERHDGEGAAPTHAPSRDKPGRRHLSAEQCAHRGTAQLPQAKGNHRQADERAAGEADDEGDARGMELQERRADRVEPEPRAAEGEQHHLAERDAPQDAERAAHEREHRAFACEQPSHAPLRPAAGEQDADFAGPLLKAQPHENGGEHQRGGDDEEAEAKEELFELRCAAGREERLRANWPQRQAELRRVERELRGKGFRGEAVAIRNANRCGVTEAAAPEFLTGGERDERLRRGVIVVPVIVVLAANAGRVVGERRVPVAHVFVRDAFDFWGPGGVGGRRRRGGEAD